MLRATLIIFTAVFSVVILKMKLFRHHYLSLLLITVGLVLVGLSQAFESNNDVEPDPNNNNTSNAASQMIVGIIILIIG